MANTQDEFGKVLERWKKENEMPWGRLRYEISRMNIARHIGKKKLRILDVGGGNGMDTIYYAKQGHTVTLTDSSPKMLSEARNLVDRQDILGQITLIQTEPASLLENLNEQRYDLILCHMMIEFVPDPKALFCTMCSLLAPGGIISLLETNRYSDVYMRAFQLNSLPDAIEAVGIREYFHPYVSRITPRFSADDFIDLLEENGCSLVGQYGVLNLCAYLPNEPKFIPKYYNDLQELENQLSNQFPYYLLARFFQVIGRKE